MKVALCLSGKYRNAKQCYPSIKKNILDIYNPDIFISSWKNGEDVQHIMYDTQFHENDASHNDILKLYNPISFELETYDSSPQGFFYGIVESTKPISNEEKDGCMRLLGQWYKRMRCNFLKSEWERKNNFLYDLVIVCRFDLEFFEPIQLDTQCKDTVKFASGYDWAGGLGDLFFWGSSNLIDKVCQIFNKISHYRSNYNKPNEDHLKTLKFNNHIILSYHLSHNNILLERFDSKIKLRNSFMLNVEAKKRWRVLEKESGYLYNTTLSHVEYIDNFNEIEKEFYEDNCYNYFPSYSIWEGYDCLVKNEDTVLDIGSGFGFFSHRVSEKVERVYSLESDPYLFSCLSNNILDRNNVTPIKISHNTNFIKLIDFLQIEKIDFLRISSKVNALEFLKNFPKEILEITNILVFESDNLEECHGLELGFNIKNYLYNFESGNLRLFNYLKKY